MEHEVCAHTGEFNCFSLAQTLKLFVNLCKFFGFYRHMGLGKGRAAARYPVCRRQLELNGTLAAFD
jgi:hypothetical protein